MPSTHLEHLEAQAAGCMREAQQSTNPVHYLILVQAALLWQSLANMHRSLGGV